MNTFVYIDADNFKSDLATPLLNFILNEFSIQDPASVFAFHVDNGFTEDRKTKTKCDLWAQHCLPFGIEFIRVRGNHLRRNNVDAALASAVGNQMASLLINTKSKNRPLFVLCSSDSDFSIVNKNLRKSGAETVVLCEGHSRSNLRLSSTRFINLDYIFKPDTIIAIPILENTILRAMPIEKDRGHVKNMTDWIMTEDQFASLLFRHCAAFHPTMFGCQNIGELITKMNFSRPEPGKIDLWNFYERLIKTKKHHNYVILLQPPTAPAVKTYKVRGSWKKEVVEEIHEGLDLD
ncbi:hypothetical protein RCL1_002319 [Eukaryota sp. TZLM3-RCL]